MTSKVQKAIDDLANSLTCRHEWKDEKTRIIGAKVQRCVKCKMKVTEWPGQKKTRRAHEARVKSPSVRLATKRSAI